VRDFLEANTLWIGMLGAFVVSGLVYYQHPDKLGDAAATLAALVAVVAVYYQGYLTNLTHSIDVVRSYDDRFDGLEFRTNRRDVARKILALAGGPATVIEEADEILDFFETIGLLAKRKTVDTTMVWSLFQYPLHGYWLVAKDSIAKRRRDDPTLYEDFVWLHDRVTRIEKRKRRCSDADIAPASVGEFLAKEKDA
jgi:hypothetical protein